VNNPYYNLEKFEAEVVAGNINKAEKGNLVIYNYTQQCVFEKNWNRETLMARGIMFNKVSGVCVAKPFPKFFNLGEMPETTMINLPKESYIVTDKVDGSLGVMYYSEEELERKEDYSLPNIATRGSFESPQAIEGTRILREMYPQINYEATGHELTLLFEIVYPENRMSQGARLVIDYGNMRDLILLAIIDKTQDYEWPRRKVEAFAQKYHLKFTKTYDYTIDQMVEMQKTLPVTQEGFVVHYPNVYTTTGMNGLRVKIKGEEYLRMSKLLNSYSPISVWEALEHGNLPEKYLMNVPEEIRLEIVQYERILNEKYCALHNEIRKSMYLIPKNVVPEVTPNYRKIVGLWLKQNKHPYPSMVFPYILGREDAIEKFVLDSIRPTANVL
jgi:RNA ligase